MPALPLSDDLARKAAEAVQRYRGNMAAAARELGMSRTTLQNRVERAAERGMMLLHPPAMPGFRVRRLSTQEDADGTVTKRFVQQTKAPSDEAFVVPKGHAIKGVSALIDADGRTVQQWLKTRAAGIDPLVIAEQLKTAFRGYKPAARVTKSVKASADLLTLLPCNDWHVGMFSWGEETDTNWDLKIAQERIGAAVEDTIARTPASGRFVVLGGGDLLHADNQDNETSRSGNNLDVDGRYPKVVDAAAKLMVRTVDAALARHRHVTVRILPGNHDEHSAIAVAYFLAAWYRNEKRVEVDTDPSLFWWMRFGKVMLGATHGHTVRVKDMPSIMAHRRAEDWGATKFRYVHGFHVHHSAKFATEGNGVVSEVHQAPVPQDAWHYGAGFLSGRSLQAITYHRDYGEIGRVRTAMIDGGEKR